MKEKKVLGKFYSPYQKNETETMDDWYESYLKDEKRVMELDDWVFCKIIHRSEFYLKSGCCLLVVFEPSETVCVGDILVDEEGHEFTVKSFEMMRFAGNNKWYLKAVPALIIGTSYDIGEYLAKK